MLIQSDLVRMSVGWTSTDIRCLQPAQRRPAGEGRARRQAAPRAEGRRVGKPRGRHEPTGPRSAATFPFQLKCAALRGGCQCAEEPAKLV